MWNGWSHLFHRHQREMFGDVGWNQWDPHKTSTSSVFTWMVMVDEQICKGGRMTEENLWGNFLVCVSFLACESTSHRDEFSSDPTIYSGSCFFFFRDMHIYIYRSCSVSGWNGGQMKRGFSVVGGLKYWWFEVWWVLIVQDVHLFALFCANKSCLECCR